MPASGFAKKVPSVKLGAATAKAMIAKGPLEMREIVWKGEGGAMLYRSALPAVRRAMSLTVDASLPAVASEVRTAMGNIFERQGGTGAFGGAWTRLADETIRRRRREGNQSSRAYEGNTGTLTDLENSLVIEAVGTGGGRFTGNQRDSNRAFSMRWSDDQHPGPSGLTIREIAEILEYGVLGGQKAKDDPAVRTGRRTAQSFMKGKFGGRYSIPPRPWLSVAMQTAGPQAMQDLTEAVNDAITIVMARFKLISPQALGVAESESVAARIASLKAASKAAGIPFDFDREFDRSLFHGLTPRDDLTETQIRALTGGL